MDRHYLLHALEGTIRLEAGGRRWTLPPARASLIVANEPVTITILSRLTSASVLFAPGFIADPVSPLTVFGMSPLARALTAECRQWSAEVGTLSPYASRVFGLLGEVVLTLADHPSPCVMPAPASPAMTRALALTEEQADGNPAFADIARATGQSERALSRRFSEEMGMTWTEALRRIRIIRSVELLATTKDSVTQIGLAVGYGSTSAFIAAFRDLIGCSPTEYRRSFDSNAAASGDAVVGIVAE